MPNGGSSNLAFYCPQHQLRFRATGDAVVICEQGAHALGHGFPDSSWWEYCCDCDTFWPTKTDSGYLQRSECTVCERPTSKRYVCTTCQVVSIESPAPVKRKRYSISTESGISPNCPGCSKLDEVRPTEHECAEVAASILTARSACPFCESTLRVSDAPTASNKGLDVCSFCGTHAEIDSEFCGRCGKQIAQPPKTVSGANGLSGDLEPCVSGQPTTSSSVVPQQEFRISEIASRRIDIPEAEMGESSNLGKTRPQAVFETSLNESEAPLPIWQKNSSEAPPKRQVRWVPAAIAVAITVVVVVMAAIILSGERTATISSNSKSPVAPPGMVSVPGGEFMIGSDSGDVYEKPTHKVTVKPFFLDVIELTCGEYAKFLQGTGHKVPAGWRDKTCPKDSLRKPVTGVDWYDANEYCKWAGKRLPTEEEWEMAAKGFDGRKYPWGNDWVTGYVNAENASQGLTDVDQFKGASPYGAIGMVGNAWEWTASKLVAYPGGRIPPQELGDANLDLRVIRGGSWESDRLAATTTYRWGWPASGGKDYSNTGFRCVKDIQ